MCAFFISSRALSLSSCWLTMRLHRVGNEMSHEMCPCVARDAYDRPIDCGRAFFHSVCRKWIVAIIVFDLGRHSTQRKPPQKLLKSFGTLLKKAKCRIRCASTNLLLVLSRLFDQSCVSMSSVRLSVTSVPHSDTNAKTVSASRQCPLVSLHTIRTVARRAQSQRSTSKGW